MGKIADALRANLRELAHADARLLRDLDAELPSPAAAPLPQALSALPDGLDKLGVKELKALCKQRGLTGYSSLKKPQLLERLRGGAPQAPLKPSATSLSMTAIEARLDRLEALLIKIADHLGVS